MNADFDRLREIFFVAVEQHPAQEWDAYLDQACAADGDLRRNVAALLKAHAEGGSLPDWPAPATDETGVYQPVTVSPGTVIGSYKLLEQIGEGGFGVVFMAEQTQPVRRKVALKVLKPGMDTRQVVGRFEAERQALALMNHPNIAHVFDGGVTPTGRPYFVTKLVRGIPITEFCDQNHLPVRQRLELFISVCQAIQHAHLKGIIHRDVKPTNVLVTLHDGKPMAKVIDFGIAKASGQQLTEKTLFTNFAQMIGTPLYMSPEQAQMSGIDIDTRTDIYALGVLLYELLTGTTPFDRERLQTVSFDEIRRIIREEEPPRPSTRISTLGQAAATVSAQRESDPMRLSQLFRGELDWIVMKALEKDRNRRYETASAFAADVQRYLADEPVLACPPSVGYRFKKFARRNKAVLATVGVVIFFIMLLGGLIGWGVRDRAAREEEIAGEAARKLALTEEGIRQALDRGTNNRAELHALLKKPGGVQQLLNQPARWELFLKTAQGELAHARRLAVRAEADVDEELTQAMDQLEQQLTSDQADYDLARHLEKIRLDRASWVKGSFDDRTEDEISKALTGFAVLTDDPADVAARIASSPIKDQLVAALDQWNNVPMSGGARTRARVRAVLRLVTRDPAWGDRLRTPNFWLDQEALGKLIAQARIAELSPQLCINIGAWLQDIDQKESWLRRAQAEHPTDFWLSFALAELLNKKNNPVEAAGFCRVALAIRPGTATVHCCLGIALEDQGKLDEAVDAYQKAIALDPNYADPYSNLGLVLRALKKLEEAKIACHKAIELDPKSAAAHNNLGTVLSDQGKLDKAIVAYHTAIKIDPKVALFHSNLGNALLEQKKLDEAVDACHKAIELDPKYAQAHGNLGNALKAQGKLDKAIDAYHKAIKLDPKKAIFHYNLGVALEAQRKLLEAIDAYREAIKIDPKHVAHNNLGNTFRDRGELDDAIAHYRLAIEHEPNRHTFHSNLGWAFYRQQKLDDAVACYREAVRLDEKSSWCWQVLGWCLYRTGNWRDSIEALEKSCKLQEGGKGDAAQWIVLALAHARLAAQPGLPEKEREHQQAEARRLYEQADKGIDSWWRVRPDDSYAGPPQIWDFREEARKLMGANGNKK
jgi:tetratricopeptide (TPR) repeat protein/serine/threonine protein kinase